MVDFLNPLIAFLFSERKKSNHEIERLAAARMDGLPTNVGRSRLRWYWCTETSP